MEASVKKIILATDFSEASKDATHHAQLLAHAYQAELKVLHVFDTSPWDVPSSHYLTTGVFDFKARASDLMPEELYRLTESKEQVRQRGKDALKKLADSFDLEVETIFTVGDPGHEIVRVAEELNTDLIVLGTHGYGGWQRFAVGSVAELVVRHAPCAVLTVRPRGK
jgi:nucleotide-binding universal stress UspA family protein